MAHTRTAWYQLALDPCSSTARTPWLQMGVLAACAALGALLPDLDASESKVKHLKTPGTGFKPFLLPSQVRITAHTAALRREFKPFLLPAQVVHRTEQHRGLFYSLWGLVMITLMIMPFLLWDKAKSRGC